MEEEDDVVPEPDARGCLDLTNRAWVNLDPAIFNYSMKLVVLDVSYNHIADLPMQIGELSLLREFRASFNKLLTIPPEIGKLKRLRKLVLNGNKIRAIPPDIGKLEMLEELIISENAIEELPLTIANMSALRVLKLQNNRLRTLPQNIADVVTLEEIDCSNNKDLEIIPALWRGDTSSILFICRIHRDYNVRMEELTVSYNDLIKHSQFLEQEQMTMKEKVAEYKHVIEQYKKFMPPKATKKMDKAMALADEEKKDDSKQFFEKCIIS